MDGCIREGHARRGYLRVTSSVADRERVILKFRVLGIIGRQFEADERRRLSESVVPSCIVTGPAISPPVKVGPAGPAGPWLPCGPVAPAGPGVPIASVIVAGACPVIVELMAPKDEVVMVMELISG